MSSLNVATKLNPVQLHLLELFSKNMGDEDLIAIKNLLTQYYKQKIEQEVNAFWDKNNFDKESWNQATRDKHFRSENSDKK